MNIELNLIRPGCDISKALKSISEIMDGYNNDEYELSLTITHYNEIGEKKRIPQY